MPQDPIHILPNPENSDSRVPNFRHVAHLHQYISYASPELGSVPVGVPLSQPNGSSPAAFLNNSYWNNQLQTEVARLFDDRRHPISAFRNATSELVQIQNDINRRLTLEFSSNNNTKARPVQGGAARNIRLIKSTIIKVSAAQNSELAKPKTDQRRPENPTDLSFISSHLSLDLLNMGKIQEFKDKVGVSQVKMPRKDIWRCLGAEFLGTFLLVLVGCGSTIPLEGSEKPQLIGVALCFGLLVATLAETIGHVSGCHINPAVTVAMLVTGKIQLVKAILYVVVQCVAAIVAIGVLKALTPEPSEELAFGYTSLTANLSTLQGFGIEFLLTFVLLFIIFAVTDEHRTDLKGSAPLSIGLCLASLVLYGGPLTGAGLNPARVLGPCVILGKFENHWIYWFGPLGGAVTAAAVYQHIFRALRPDEVAAAEIAMENKAREREANKENSVSPPV